LSGTAAGASRPRTTLIAELDDERFDREQIHDALTALDARGIRLDRFHHVPDDVAAWIDAEFGGAISPAIARGGVWVATARASERRIAFAAYGAQGSRVCRPRKYANDVELGLLGPLLISVDHADDTGLRETLLHAALFSLRERGYRRAVIAALENEADVEFVQRAANAAVVERFSAPAPRRYRAILLASGSGSNVQAVLDGVANGTLPLEVAAVVVNRPVAPVIERARSRGVPVQVVVWERSSESREKYDAKLREVVEVTAPDLVLTLGWMHVLAPDFVATFPELMNIHPAFLPLDPARDRVTMPDGVVIPVFRGAHALRDALAANSPWVGASVHYVTNEVDRGEVLARAPLRVEPDEGETQLLQRLHPLEHRCVALAIDRWVHERE
jgi:phosphoribosylglycinamide formyltransferase-1